jgi:putative transposase
MPWKECKTMDEKLKFVARRLNGERMSDLCEEFGISRKTGHKIWNRYQDFGIDALKDRTRRPYRYANKIPDTLEKYIVRLKKERPSWGAPKIRELVLRKYPDIKPPAKSTVHAVLARNGFVKPQKRVRIHKPLGTALSWSKNPNDLWCADFKGEFMLQDRRYCYPLTITDHATRYLLACEALETTKETFAMKVFEHAFKEFGLPRAIKTDNGVPFASANALFNLSRLSVWWLRLGIEIERIKPGHPEQNGRHERMHRTLKQEATKPASESFLQQQCRFDDFVAEYNNLRPHEALEMRCPAEIYQKSIRPYVGLQPLEYPHHDKTIKVTSCGRICFDNKKVSLSKVFGGQRVGIKETDDGIWLVSFMNYDLGYFDVDNLRLEPLKNPFGPKVLPMYLE